ncbi:hypothetical protein CHLNCDRAFT_49999 [Chlorella variabilis]|uniref:L-2-hydroxyglutarate dehydrogenase, mitochondrial n=1 Tax=Chlorella variabilis TaxID=554065 RepID=E1Z518_CHLVA|nr:hypothetical protein CHLNCDRAFT_49999 [Chlorella variabilis]EFN59445.1 hypothetical protein CHLNCDRAFT_49999 [Chlorella variabilis]|eukprot:XP_005851547.1 hypothetical protein CHLNCDRAFT_49999 [Chlorella variabilis]
MRMPRALAAQHLRLLSSAAAAASGAAVSQDVSFTSPGNAGSPGADADAVVIGAGVLGLAIARELALAGRSLYYPPGSLKARLCVHGKQLLYAFCQRHGVPHRRLGKLVVATSEAQLGALHALAARGAANSVPDLRLLSAEQQHRQLYEDGGSTAPLYCVLRGGMVAALLNLLVLEDNNTAEEEEMTGAAVVNAAGLHAQAVAASLHGMPPAAIPPLHLAKGSYFSLAAGALAAIMPRPAGGGGSARAFRQLIYPLPEPGTAGLGTHLTLDLAGGVRFGPDVEWLPPGTDPATIDYGVAAARAQPFYAAIRAYLPRLPDAALQPSYSGVRPKVAGPGQPAGDFVVQGPHDHGVPGLLNLFGIESPGLTASLAIARRVAAALLGGDGARRLAGA